MNQGVSPELRPQVWKFLLNYYPYSSTAEERKQIDKDRRYEIPNTRLIA
jgi:hypothetical protein